MFVFQFLKLFIHTKMFAPLLTLDIPVSTISELQKKGIFYVEDLFNDSGSIVFSFL